MLASALTIEGAVARTTAEAASRQADREFVCENHGFVTRLLYSRGVPRGHLDDAVQQVFVVALPKRSEIREARAFLYGVAVRIAQEQARAARRHPLPDDADGAEREASRDPHPEELVDRKQRQAFVDGAIARMPEDVRTAFVLFEIEALTMREIAETTGVPQGTVASRVRRGRELFREAADRIRARLLREDAR
jgi:RNA polymerase sigma-70 factor (ECF subfamily)